MGIIVNQEPGEQKSKRVVLIVDDEKPLALAIAATLDLGELETIIAHNGNQALELAHTGRPPPRSPPISG